MTATAADALVLLAPSTPEQWPAGILAAADIRQARAEAATPGPYYVVPNDLIGGTMIRTVPEPPSTNDGCDVGDFIRDADCEHIAAEANPAHALAAVRLWRAIVNEMEIDAYRFANGDIPYVWTECARDARAYLGGSP